MKNVTDNYKKEFEKNSYWLKFGFHSRNADSRYSENDKNSLYSDYIETNRELERIVGKKSISDTLRIHCWQGNKDEITKMQNDSCYPLKALLTSNDGKQSYFLDKTQMVNIDSDFFIKDSASDLEFYKTDLRIENITNVHKIAYKKLINSHKKQITIFTHAWALYNEKVMPNAEFVLEKLMENS